MEQKIRNMKVEKKLKYSFRIVIILFSVALMASIIGTTIISLSMNSFYKKAYTNSTLQMEIRKDTQVVAKQLLWSLTTDSKVQTLEHLDEADAYAVKVHDNVVKLADNLGDQELADKLTTAVDELAKQRAVVAGYSQNMDNEKAISAYNGAYTKAIDNAQNVLIEIGDYTNNSAENSYIVILVLCIGAIILMLVMGIVSVTVSIRLSKMITTALIIPIGELETAATKLSNGELDAEITYASEDELGALAQHFKQACGFMGEVIEDANELLTEMADGNFNIATKKEEKYVGEFEQLILAMRKMNRTLNKTLKSIDEGAEQVAVGADQMAESAVSLAEGATEQAGAVEELTATIEDVAQSAEQSANAAQSAYLEVQEAVNDAQRGREEMNHLTDAMEKINNTSMEIQNIIGAIEDIAAQTNLLSLNASIEAARAGEAGKGFAVVADQIGKLAAESAQSAVNTRQLIAKSLEEVANGNQITEKTVSVLENIVENMVHFADAAKGASDASNMQADLMSQIKGGVEQISLVIQNNSAAAEETSATSEELAAQSESLKSIVAKFQLRQD